MPLLLLDERVLPVVLLEGSKARDAVDAKVYNDGVLIFCGEITELAEI